MSATKLRHGFKTLAENIASELRGELRLDVTDRLDPSALADHLAVPILYLGDLARSGARTASIQHFHGVARSSFSAMTVLEGHRRLIVVNDAHASVRQASDVAHELSHLILEHKPHVAVSADGCRLWNDEMEKEADWLAGVLLVPRGAALVAARERWPLDEAASHFGVSEQMMRWRLSHTGAYVQAQRERAKLGRAPRRRRVLTRG